MADSSSIFNKFDANIDAPEVLRGGELINGSIEIELKKKIIINKINLTIAGVEKVHKSGAHQTIFQKNFVVLERPPGKPDAGHFAWVAEYKYKLPFEFSIPKNLPTSYEGPHAHTRYFYRIDFVYENDEGREATSSILKGLVVLNPAEGFPVEADRGKLVENEGAATTGSCCCRKLTRVTASLRQTSYVPGEEVVSSIEFSNFNKKYIGQISARLVDYVKSGTGSSDLYLSDPRTIVESKILLPEEPKKGKKGKTVKLEGLHLLTLPSVLPSRPLKTADETKLSPDLPPLSPTRNTLNSLYGIDYVVQIVVGKRIIVDLPITVLALNKSSGIMTPSIIGSVPFQDPEEEGVTLFNSPQMVTLKYFVAGTAPQETKLSQTNGNTEIKKSVATHHETVHQTVTTVVSETHNGVETVTTTVIENGELPKELQEAVEEALEKAADSSDPVTVSVEVKSEIVNDTDGEKVETHEDTVTEAGEAPAKEDSEDTAAEPVEEPTNETYTIETAVKDVLDEKEKEEADLKKSVEPVVEAVAEVVDAIKEDHKKDE